MIGCLLGRYGYNCEYDCSTHCSGKTCDIKTGNCVCTSGYRGRKCDNSKRVYCHVRYLYELIAHYFEKLYSPYLIFQCLTPNIWKIKVFKFDPALIES